MTMTKPTRGGSRPGAGRTAKDPTGQPMVAWVKIRATRAQQEDAKLVGPDALRAFITRAADKLRKDAM